MHLKIIYEDEAVLVVHKPAGFPVQTGKVGSMDCVSELKNYLGRKQPKGKIPYLGIVHRLDQPVEGLLVFAKTKHAAAKLSAQVRGNGGDILSGRKTKEDEKSRLQQISKKQAVDAFEDSMLKYYEAVVYGKMPHNEGELCDYLLRDSQANTSHVAVGAETSLPEARYSRLAYRVIAQEKETQKLWIHLYTGRHHQIRLQLAHAGAPILGDVKYGSAEAEKYALEHGIRTIALRAVRLEFVHPVTGKKMIWEL